MNPPRPASAFVTGADHGLGRALVNEFARRGLRVYAGVHNPDTSIRFPFASPLVQAIPLDVGEDDSVARAAAVLDAGGIALDVLVNNAGRLGDIERGIGDDLDFEDMQRTFNVNALGPLRVTRGLLGALRRGSLRSIMNISSEAGSIGGQDWRAGWFGYCMSKAALNMGSVLCQNGLENEGFRHLLVHPGHLKTFMRGSKDETGAFEPEEVAARLCDLALADPGPGSARGVPFIDHLGRHLPW